MAYPDKAIQQKHPLQTGLFVLFWMLCVLSGIAPHSRVVWFFHALVPITITLLLFAFRKKYIPSIPTALLLFTQCVLLLAGAFFSFHRIPFLRVTLSTGEARSLVDWLTHFVDGLVYAGIFSDLANQRDGKFSAWLSGAKGRTHALIIGFCFASALLWEITEWIALLISGNLFVMTGGIAMDTVVDVGLTLLGGMAALPFVRQRGAAVGQNRSMSSQ